MIQGRLYYSLISIFFIAVTLSLHGQTFRASLRPTKFRTYEPVDLNYSVENFSSPGFVLPEVDGMTVISGPAVYQNSMTINGVTSGSTEYSYSVMFTKPGSYTIPAITIKDGKKKVTSNVLKFNVARGKSPIPPRYQDKEVLLVVETSSDHAVMGECIALDLIVYTFVNNVVIGEMELPMFNDGWVQMVEEDDEFKLEVDQYRGTPYFSARLRKLWMVPFETGELSYPSVKMQAILTVPLGDPESAYYQIMEMPFKLASEPKLLQIDPLPEENVPDGFQNAIGNFKLKTLVDRDKLKANEPLRIKITVEGMGNFPVMNPPSLALPDGFDVFEPRVENDFKVEDDGIKGFKEFEFLVVPRVEGVFQLGPFPFAYFDPRDGIYHEVITDSFQLEVKGIVKDSSTVMMYENGIFIGGRVRKKRKLFFGTPLFYGIWISFFAISVLFIVFRKPLFMRTRDVVKENYNKAENQAKRLLVEAEKFKVNGDADEAIKKLSDCYFGYMSDKFQLTKANVTREGLFNIFGENEQGVLAIRILEALDKFRFMPAGNTEMDALFKDIKQLIAG